MLLCWILKRSLLLILSMHGVGFQASERLAGVTESRISLNTETVSSTMSINVRSLRGKVDVQVLSTRGST